MGWVWPEEKRQLGRGGRGGITTDHIIPKQLFSGLSLSEVTLTHSWA